MTTDSPEVINAKLDELRVLLTTDGPSVPVVVPTATATSNGLVRVVKNAVIRVRNLIVHEFPVLGAAALAGVNAATDQSAKGYAVAGGIALLRFVVSPHFEAAAIQEKAVSPEIVAAINAALAARGIVPSPDA